MYLLIFKDGSIMKSEKLSDDDKLSVDSGCMQVIDISNPLNPLDLIFVEGQENKEQWVGVEYRIAI